MLGRIKNRINAISTAGRISITVGCFAAIILMLAAIYLSCAADLPFEYKYLREQLADVASKIYALGVVLGLVGDRLLTA